VWAEDAIVDVGWHIQKSLDSICDGSLHHSCVPVA